MEIDRIPCIIFSPTDIRPVNLYQGIDPAPGIYKDKGDYFVDMMVGIDSLKRVYVVEYLRARIEVTEQANHIIEFYLKYKKAPKRVTIETIAYQEALRSLVKDTMSEQGIYIPGLEKGVKPRLGKDSRHDKIVGIAKTGRLYIKESMEALRTELLTIHRTKRSPDCLDALWNCLYHSQHYSGEEIFDMEEQGGYVVDIDDDTKDSGDWLTI